jgi:hypothetical protein
MLAIVSDFLFSIVTPVRGDSVLVREQSSSEFQLVFPSFFRSHSCRRGHLAAIHASTSSRRHRVVRPMRTGDGMSPAESQRRQVRDDVPQSAAALRTESNNVSSATEEVDVSDIDVTSGGPPW